MKELNKYTLFLDDNPSRAALAYSRWPDEKVSFTIWCQNVQEVIDTFGQDYDFEEVHLDHDLEGRTFVNPAHDNCGMEIVRWLEQNAGSLHKFADTLFIIHSHNYYAGLEMTQRIKKLGLNAKYIPFGEDEVVL